MELQHINAKLLLRRAGEVDLDPLIPVFHTWIQDQVLEELLLDVADYRHVEAGPGVILIGHEANYSVDNTDHHLGVRYNRKGALNGTNQDHLGQAVCAALTACQRLEKEPRLGGKICFDGQEIEISVNDRLLAPNDNSTFEALKPDFQTLFHRLFREDDYDLKYGGDPRRVFAVRVKASQKHSTSQLLENLA